jgi:hypothetical protein
LSEVGRDPRQALYEALRVLEDRAKANRGTAYSRRAVSRAVHADHGFDLGKGGQRIGAWLNTDPALRRVPRDADEVWALVRVWISLAGPPAKTAAQLADDQRYWTRLVTAARQGRPRARATPEPARQSLAGQTGEWKKPGPAVPGLTGQEVARPALVNELVAALTQDTNSAVAMTTQVTGATGGGGFGKTTLARLLVHHPAVQARYSDGIVWRAIGADTSTADIVGYLNDLIQAFTGASATLTDPMLVTAHLRKVLTGRRVLIVVDDVWFPFQLEPFLPLAQNQATEQGQAEPSTVTVLVTTRRPNVLPATSRIIHVDSMTGDEAEHLLMRGLPPVHPGLISRLLRLTSRWPLLLSLLNGAARTDVTAGAEVNDVLNQLADHLGHYGPELDLTDENGRSRAVTATLQASLDRLSDSEQERFLELAVFGENVEIPIAILERYWAATGSWRLPQIRNFAPRLLDLGLAAEYLTDQHRPRIRLHDVIHAWLRMRAVDQRLAGLPGLHAAFLDAHRSLVPTSPNSQAVSWWSLPIDPIDATEAAVTDYLWAWIPTHLHHAHRVEELDALLAQPQWILTKLALSSPAALEADLELGHSPVAAALARVVRQDGYLLTPLEPEGSVTATLAGRISQDPVLTELRQALLASIRGLPHLAPVIPLPDLPHPALHRTLSGHARGVQSLAVAPDGSWLAAAGGGFDEMSVRIWNPATGQEQHTLTWSSGSINALAVAPDGTWLAAAGSGFDEGSVRIWNPATGQKQHTFTGPAGSVNALAVAPDGSWLAAADSEGSVRIWNPATGQKQHTLTLPGGSARALAVAPDGSWLAAAGGTFDEGSVRIWNPATGQEQHTLTLPRGSARALAVAPDGSWLATTNSGLGDGTVRIWNPATGLAVASFQCGSRLSVLVTVRQDMVCAGGSSGLYLLRFVTPGCEPTGAGVAR